MNVKLLTLSLVSSLSLLSAGELKLKSKVQPLLSIEQRGNFSDEGDLDWGFNRLKLSTQYKQKVGGVKLRYDFDLDFTKEHGDDMIREAAIEAEFMPQLVLTAGQKKVPLLRNDYIGSGSLTQVHRSYSSDHLRDQLGVTGYLPGLALSGAFLEQKLSYHLGVSFNDKLDGDGIAARALVMLPSLKLRYEPLEFLALEYAALFPEFTAELKDGTKEYTRLALMAVSLEAAAPRLYRTEFELLIGADTTDGRALMQLQPDHDENLSMSLLSSHIVRVPMREEQALELAVAGEFLNGLTYYDGAYHDRSFNYALYGSLAYHFDDDLSVQLAVDERFDKEFAPIDQMRIALQATYAPTLLKRKK